MPLRSRSPGADRVRNVVNKKIAVRGHVENVLPVRRDDALTRLKSLASDQVRCAPTGLRRKGARARSCISASKPFENIEYQVSVVLHHDGGRTSTAGLRGP